jgi:hypothetical protein
LGNLSLAALEVFIIVRGGFWSFFGLFPSVPIVTRKMPGVVIIKGPLTAHKKKIEPWTLILVISALLSKVW